MPVAINRLLPNKGISIKDWSGDIYHRQFPTNGLQFYVPLWNVEQQGFLLSYDGNDYLSATTADFRSADSAGAIEVWFKTSTTGAWQSLVTSSDGDTGEYFLSFHISNTNKLRIAQANKDAENALIGTTTVTDGQWHHAVLSSNGTSYTVILDGVAESLTGTNDGDWFADTLNRENITIGTNIANPPNSYFTGSIGTVRVYSQAMTVATALANKNAGQASQTTNTAGLVYDLNLSEGTGNPVDTVGSLTMTATGATWVEGLMDRSTNAYPITSLLPTWSSKGRTFNGTSDTIKKVGTITGIKTALLWINPDDNTTRSIADFDAGTHSVEMDGSGDLTATGWDTPTTYVNGVVASAVTQSAYNLVGVTSATAFNATALVLGQEASYYDGIIGEAWLYNRELTLGEITQIYNATHWRYL